MPKTADKTRYIKRWSEEDLSKALEEVQNGIPLRSVCRKYPKIPRSTLQFRSSSKFVKSSLGPSPILSSLEEKELVGWIIDCQKKGFPRRKEDVQVSVKQFLDDNPRENPFTNNYPGHGWYKSFLKRNPELTERKSEAITAASSKISESDIRKWFSNIECYLKEKSYDNILQFPERIFNGDETNFQLCPQNKKVLAPKGAKNIYEIDGAQAKSSLTVLFCFSASGQTSPPLIIYPYKRMPRDIAESVPEGFHASCSDTGWMKSEIFYEYIGNVFYPFVKKLDIAFPIILFVDGHKTHLDRKLSTLCTKLQIVLVALYPNATRILQPADVSTFKPLKDGWRKGVLEWRRNNPTEELTKKSFAPLLNCVISKTLRPEIIINGFRACGLFPWNPSAIQFDKCLGKANSSNLTEKPKLYKDLTFENFSKIIGKDRLLKFDDYDSSQENDDLNTIYNLWKAFQEELGEKQYNGDKQGKETTDTEISKKPEENNYVTTDKQEENESNVTELGKDANIDPIIDKDNQDIILSIQEDIDISTLPIVIEENGVISDIFPRSPSPIIEENSLLNPNDTNKNSDSGIGNYLFYYDTPERKGIKNTEKMPYIITSTPWKEIKDKKETEKKRKVEEQHKRKLEREAKKIKRTQEMNEKNVRKKKKTVNQAIELLGNEAAEHKTLKKINVTSNIIIKPHIDEQYVEFIEGKEGSTNDSSLKNDSFSEKLAKATRQVFELKEENLSLKNPTLCSGICFICTLNISKQKSGYKCSECSRSYHLNCIIKHNLHKSNSDIFTCINCLKKKTNTIDC